MWPLNAEPVTLLFASNHISTVISVYIVPSQFVALYNYFHHCFITVFISTETVFCKDGIHEENISRVKSCPSACVNLEATKRVSTKLGIDVYAKSVRANLILVVSVHMTPTLQDHSNFRQMSRKQLIVQKNWYTTLIQILIKIYNICFRMFQYDECSMKFKGHITEYIASYLYFN